MLEAEEAIPLLCGKELEDEIVKSCSNK